MHEQVECESAAVVAALADGRFGQRFDLAPQFALTASAKEPLEFRTISEPAESSIELLDKPAEPPAAVVVSALGYVSRETGERERARISVGVGRHAVVAIVRWEDDRCASTSEVDGPLVEVIRAWAGFAGGDSCPVSEATRSSTGLLPDG